MNMQDFISRSAVLALLPDTDTVGPKPSRLRQQVEAIQSMDFYQPKEHWETLNEYCENLRAELDQVKRERDAAVKALRRHCDCDDCANGENNQNCEEFPFCNECPLDCSCKDCERASKWEWRGPVED